MATTDTTATTTTPEASIAAYIEMGGRRWQKNGADRIYFNDIPAWYGFTFEHYKSGSLSAATLDGSSISNYAAQKICRTLADGNFYYDVTARQFRSSLDKADHNRIAANIRARKVAILAREEN